MARRGHGEGTIYQRKDGRWVSAITVGYTETGARERKWVYGKTRKEVAARLLELQSAQAEGLAPTRDDVTVKKLIEAWMQEIVVPSVRPTTRRSYEQLTRLHILPQLGKEKLSRLDARMVQAWLRGRSEAGLSPRTVAYLRATLRRALNQAVKWGWLSRNVVTLTDAPKQARTQVPAYTVEQAQRILAAVDQDRHAALFTVILALGLRKGEALGLRWEDVTLLPEDPSSPATGGVVQIRFQLQHVGGEFLHVPPKSEAGRRTLALPAFVAERLRRHRLAQEEQRKAMEEMGLWENPWNLVFTTAQGKPFLPRNINRDFTKLLARAGIEHLRIHDLRHLCASLLVAQDTHPRTIMGILGHSQISLTMDTYSHLLPSASQSAAQGMDALLGKARSE